MMTNVGRWDRWVRVVVGVLLLWVAAAVAGSVRWVALVAGIMLVATGVVGYCPMYGVCRISTAAPSKKA